MTALFPLYGFLEGDTLGLLVLADADETLDSLARKLGASASVRVAPSARHAVRVGGSVLDGRTTVRAAGLAALDRFDVVRVTP